MDLQTELKYDARTDEVFAMLCDEGFRKQVCEATLARSHDVSVEARETGAHVRMSRMMPAPDVAKTFVGDTMEVVQVEDWGDPADDNTRTADLRVDIPGKPASMRGQIVLAPDRDGSGTTQRVTGDIRVKIPLIGGRLEKEIARALLAAIKEEGKIGTRWLAG